MATSKKKETAHVFKLRVPRQPVDLWGLLEKMAAANRRSLNQELLTALEDRLIQAGFLDENGQVRGNG